MRAAARLTLPTLALLLLAAHFFRGGQVVLAAVSATLIALLAVRSPWASRLLQAALLLGTLEWIRTGWVLASQRVALDQPYGRLVAILGIVAALTALAVLAVRGRPGVAR